MAVGFRNLTVYTKRIFNDFNKRPEEIGRLFNYIPDKSRNFSRGFILHFLLKTKIKFITI